MLTPAFEIRQDDNFITIIIKAPFTKISETEIFIEDREFKFYSKPYYLRLNLPGNIVEDGQERAEYKAETGEFNVRVAKATAGEYFDGLDMLTKLLAPSGQASATGPLIEALDGEKCQDEDVEFDWQIEQCAYDEEDVLLKGPSYGFANQRCGILKRLQTEIPDMIDLFDADSVPQKDRRELRLADEQEHFDDDYYIADLYENEAIQSLLDFRPWWEDVYKEAKSGAAPEDSVIFTDDEKEKMRKLPRKEYVLDERDQRTAFLSLVDIIFAYAYDHRTTEGENNVESGWTIRKLSATLSWLETYSGPEEVVVASYRRCLSYPLYRHWKLTARIFRDVRHIFSAGRRCMLKCLLDVHSLLLDGDCRYILNDLYITDYCVWIQQVSEKKLSSLARSLTKVKVTKSDVDLELELLEQAAELAVEEQEETANQVTDSMAAMTVAPGSGSSDSTHQSEAALTDDDKLARLAEELQITGSQDDTEEAASRGGDETVEKEDEQQERPKSDGDGPGGKCREVIRETPEDNDSSGDVKNTKASSDVKKVTCSAETAKSSCGSGKDSSHDRLQDASGDKPVRQQDAIGDRPVRQQDAIGDRPVRQQDASVDRPVRQQDATGDRPVRQQDASGDRPVRQQDASGDKPVRQQDATGDKPVCQQDASGDRPVRQQDATGDKPVRQQDATGDRPVCQQDTTGDRPVRQQDASGDRPVRQQDGTRDRSVYQQDSPQTQIKDQASLNF